MNPSSRGEVSKTGSQDDAVLWNVPELRFLEPVFEHMRTSCPNQKVFEFQYNALAAKVRIAADSLGVKFVPYQVRHSGPAWDRLKGRRTLHEVMKRGHWRTFASVQRYEKATRTMSQYHSLDSSLRTYLEAIAADLEGIMLHGRPLPAQPRKAAPAATTPTAKAGALKKRRLM